MMEFAIDYVIIAALLTGGGVWIAITVYLGIEASQAIWRRIVNHWLDWPMLLAFATLRLIRHRSVTDPALVARRLRRLADEINPPHVPDTPEQIEGRS